MTNEYEALYTNCHFTKVRYEPVKIIGWASWGEALVEFKDKTRVCTKVYPLGHHITEQIERKRLCDSKNS